MRNLNNVTLQGWVVRQPTLMQSANGTIYLPLNIGLNRDYFDKRTNGWIKHAVFIHTILFGDRAQRYQKHLTKGRLITIEGHLDNDVYEKDGKKFYREAIIPDRITLPTKNRENTSIVNSIPQQPIAQPAQPAIAQPAIAQPMQPANEFRSVKDAIEELHELHNAQELDSEIPPTTDEIPCYEGSLYDGENTATTYFAG